MTADTVWRLDRRPPLPTAPPSLDRDQRRVVEHDSGALLVLAGPGTGKTTTIVESVVRRLTDEVNPLHPDDVLVLTFGRRAAAELRTRITLRSGGGVVPRVATFHSFAYSLMRQHAESQDYLHPPRLLSGPEQQSRIRDLLLGGVDEGTSVWPAHLDEAVATRGFAEQVRTLIAALRSRGLSGADLSGLGADIDSDVWQAAGRFADEYLDVGDAQGVLDYTEVLLRAAQAVESDPRMRQRFRAIYVDEYQDTDPLQSRLLEGLTTAETCLVAVGDPDQAIYAFRGADARALTDFRERFHADVAVLGTTRRFGPVLRQAATHVIERVPAPPELARAVKQLRHAVCDPSAAPGEVDVVTCDDERVQADFIADLLRRAALDPDRPVAWSQMAVLVRSGTMQIPALRRALVAAGVPVEVAGDELPIAREPAVIPLLAAAEVVAHPDRLTPQMAQDLLISPVGGVDPADLRRLVRDRRRRERERLEAQAQATGDARRQPPPSGQHLVDAIVDSGSLDDVPPGPLADTARQVQRLAVLIADARAVLESKGTPAEVLWSIWSSTSWSRRLQRVALRGGSAARRANADLDAVVALFDEADRAIARRGGVAGLDDFIEELRGQEIPAAGQRESAVRPDAVRLLTAHRAKGLEWDLVVVAGVQEESWPDLRRRGSLLNVDSLGVDGHGNPVVEQPATTATLLAEERRLFYVACTRARSRLVVTAVASPDDETGPQPSRFISELGVVPRQVGRTARSAQQPARALTLGALVAALRCAQLDPTQPAEVRAAATDRLALLSATTLPDGSPLAPAADPDRWWNVRSWSDPGLPMFDAARPIPMSGSSLTSLSTCGLRWFLSHEARADAQTQSTAGFGNLIHAVAELVARNVVEADVVVLDGLLERVWDQLGFEAPWHSAVEREQARAQLGRFVQWHGARTREFVGAEVPFRTTVTITTPSGDVEVVLSGLMDVVEATPGADGVSIHVADLKTGKSEPTDVSDHLQLGLYQLAVIEGAVDQAVAAAGLAGPPITSGGSSIVVLREAARGGAGGPRVSEQQAVLPGDEPPVLASLAQAVEAVRTETFHATPGSHCTHCTFRSLCPAQPEGREVVQP